MLFYKICINITRISKSALNYTNMDTALDYNLMPCLSALFLLIRIQLLAANRYNKDLKVWKALLISVLAKAL
jgi:hypothetical protein